METTNEVKPRGGLKVNRYWEKKKGGNLKLIISLIVTNVLLLALLVGGVAWVVSTLGDTARATLNNQKNMMILEVLYPRAEAAELSLGSTESPTIDYCVLDDIIEVKTPVNANPGVTEDIKRLAGEYGVDEATALRIADCESKTGKYLYNQAGSSAKGIYQFTDRTWNGYCDGDVMNQEDNIRCFMELYPSNPSWWACK